MLSKLARFAAPSAVAAVAGAVIAGLVEAVPDTDTVLTGAAAVAFVGLVAAPLLFVAAVLGRSIWRAWGWAELAARMERGEVTRTRLMAWLLYLIGACGALTAISFQALRFLLRATDARNVIAVAGPLMTVAGAVGLVVVAGPGIRLLDAALARVGRRWPALVSPRGIALGVTLVAILSLLLVWVLLIRRNIGHLNTPWLTPLVAGIAGFGLAHAAASRHHRRTLLQLATAVVVFGAFVATASWVRHHRPYVLLSVWGETELAGDAVDRLVGVHHLRDHLAVGEFEPAARPGASHPNIVLITVDTMRADRMPPYGGPAKMPALSRFARRGAVFDWAFSPGNVTRRSIPSMVTGLSPRRVHGRVAGWALRLDPRHVLLAERLKAAGYQTAGFFCCRSHFGKEHHLGLIRGIDRVFINYRGAELAKAASAYLDAHRGDRPVFVWLHLIEPHNWEKDYPRRKFGGTMSSRYDRSLTAVDEALAPLLDRLSEPENKGNTIAIITADHGEGLGDHGNRYHAGTLYDSEVHVPLVVVGPGIGSSHVGETVSTIGLAPSIIDLAGYEAPGPPQMDGRSFADLATGKRASDPDGGYAGIDAVRDRSVERDQWAVVSGPYKLIQVEASGTPKIFDVRSDPDEKKDLAATRPRLRARLMELLRHKHRIDRLSPF